MVGCGWGELRTSAPTAKHVQQVLDVDDTVAVAVPIIIKAPLHGSERFSILHDIACKIA